jgi:hypothetical protein
MSIVNAFVNQIGREMGRDAYRSIGKGMAAGRSKHTSEFNEENILIQVRNFGLLENHNLTLRELTNLVERSENADHEDFEWQELFLELDNKIDFCKDNLPSEFHEQLQRLDALNAQNFNSIKNKHVAYIETVIQFYENKGNELNAKRNAIVYLAAFFGLRAMYMKEYRVTALVNVLFVALLLIMSFLGYLTYVDPIHNAGNLPNKTVADIQQIKNLGLGIMILTASLYFVQLLRAFLKISKYNKTVNENAINRDKFVQYKAQLLAV